MTVHVGPIALDAWARLRWPAAGDDERHERLAPYRRAIEAGRLSDRLWFGAWHAHAPDTPLLATHLDPLSNHAMELRPLVGDGDVDALARLLGLVATVSDALGCTLSHRVDRDVCTALYAAALVRAGFERIGDRVEFQRPLTDDDQRGEPGVLRWCSLADVGLTDAVRTLERVAQDDPHHRSDDDARAAIESWLADPALTGDPSCLQLGFLGDHPDPVALVVAQISTTSGWSRLAYLGVVPEHRGRGLGREVHRHGLACLRRQGGDHYHGGTAATNAPMIALFERAGATRFRHLVDWHRPQPSDDATASPT